MTVLDEFRTHNAHSNALYSLRQESSACARCALTFSCICDAGAMMAQRGSLGHLRPYLCSRDCVCACTHRSWITLMAPRSRWMAALLSTMVARYHPHSRYAIVVTNFAHTLYTATHSLAGCLRLECGACARCALARSCCGPHRMFRKSRRPVRVPTWQVGNIGTISAKNANQ